MAEVTLDTLLDSVRRYLIKEENFSLIKKAYCFAEIAHRGQFRKSGEPYITHPLAVADFLASLQSGPVSIAAALLHDVIEDCGVELDQLTKEFGEEVTRLVDSVTKIGQLKVNSTLKEFQAENHRKIFIAMAKDIRVIFIKLADRLHNMQTLNYLSVEKQKKISKETLEVYAPIAHRLGLSQIKTRLEDISLFYLEPEVYQQIEDLLSKDRGDRELLVKEMEEELRKLLKIHELPAIIYGREKSIYSIYKKMHFKGHDFEDIYDIMALRVITETEVNCYEVLGHIHAAFRPLPGRFKDYIAMPKPNLYQSLHTSIVGNEGNVFEVQIRTKEMDEIAEKGIAAHWRYKENSNYDSKKEQKEIEEKLHWFRDFVIYNDEIEDSEIVESLKRDIFEANVYVLTPKGSVIDLPTGSTPIDFAYRIHTQVGHNATGATVNGHMVPLNYILKTGDIVNIKTSKINTFPSEGWLDFVRTANAKNNIKKALQKKTGDIQKDQLIEKGKQALIENCRDRKIRYEEILGMLDNKAPELAGYSCLEDLFAAIGSGTAQAQTIIDKVSARIKKHSLFDFLRKKKPSSGQSSSSNKEILVDGTDSVMTSFAACCNPIPGDEIVGFISKGLGIKIHRRSCPNIKAESKRLVKVVWNESGIDKNRSYNVNLEISANDRNQLLIDILNRLAQIKIQVNNVSATSIKENMTARIDLTISVNNKKELEDVFIILENIKDVYQVKRINRN